MASGMSEEELMEQIAERIAKNQISFDLKSKEEKKSLTPKIQIVAQSQLTEIKKSFNNIIGSNTEVIPGEVRTMILEGIYDKVASQGIKSIDAAFNSSEIIKYTENMLRYISRSDRRYNSDEMKQREFYSDSEKTKPVAEEENKKGKSSISISIRETTENASSLLRTVNQNTTEKLIERANSGDKNAQAVVVAVMSAASFVRIDKNIQEFDENALYRFVNAIENLTVAYEELGSTEALEMLEEITRRVGVELVEKDEKGNKIVNRKKIRKIAKDDHYYRPRTKEELISLTDSYEKIENYDELIVVGSNAAAQEDARITIESSIEKLENGELSKEEFSKVLKELLDADFDNSIKAISNIVEAASREKRGDKEETTIELARSPLEYYYELKKTGKSDDDLKKKIVEIMENTFEFMIDHHKIESEFMNLALKVEPEEAAIAYKNAKENFKVLPAHKKIKTLTKDELEGQRNSKDDSKTIRVISDEQKVENLTNVLNNISKVRGIGSTFRFINNGMDKASDDLRGFQEKSYYMKATLKMIEQGAEFPDSEYNKEKKKFFEKILYEQIYDEDALKQMVNMDPEIMKQILDGLIQRQNSREGDQMDTIMDLSSQIKEMSKKTKLFSTDSVEIGKTFGSTDSMFEKTKTVATSHEDDEEPGGR